MTVNQIYSLLNDTAAQVFGADAVDTLDLSGMLSLRDQVFPAGADAFLGALVDRIGKTVIRTLDFTATFPKLLMSEFEFGAILQKINIAPFDAKPQEAWNVGDVGFTPTLYNIDKADVSVDFFKGANTFEIDVTIPDVMFKTAFTSAEAMDAFITAIFDSISTSLNTHLENETRLAIMGLVAEKVKADNGVVNLLSLYNATVVTPIDAAAALYDPDFLRFAGRVIRNYIKYMAKPSVLYNTAGRVRATSRENMHVMLLTEFVSATEVFYESGVYNRDLIQLPYYTEVEYWQGTGDSAPNYDDVSTIKVKAPSAADKDDPMEITGVIGIVCDREAIGIGLYDRFSAADRNNRNRYTNYTEGATIQHFIDTSENAVIFVIQDEVTPTP